jgi:hypothetical protein
MQCCWSCLPADTASSRWVKLIGARASLVPKLKLYEFQVGCCWSLVGRSGISDCRPMRVVRRCTAVLLMCAPGACAQDCRFALYSKGQLDTPGLNVAHDHLALVATPLLLVYTPCHAAQSLADACETFAALLEPHSARAAASVRTAIQGQCRSFLEALHARNVAQVRCKGNLHVYTGAQGVQDPAPSVCLHAQHHFAQACRRHGLHVVCDAWYLKLMPLPSCCHPIALFAPPWSPMPAAPTPA